MGSPPADPAALFEIDLGEQPACLARLLGEGREAAERIAARVGEGGALFAVLAARGTSDNAARYGQYVLGVRNRLVVSLAAPSILTRYRVAPRMGGSLVIGLSQSGQSPDVVAVVAEGRRQGAVTVAVTNDPRSPLAEAAELTFDLRAGRERAVAATKTYTTELLALAMLSAAIDGGDEAWTELAEVPPRVAGAIELNRALAGAAAAFARDTRLVVLGRGYNLSTAFEVALKIKETCHVLAEPYSTADFLHGPVALLGPGLPVVAIAPASGTFDDLPGVLGLARERGARLVALSDDPAVLAQAEVPLTVPPGCPEWLSPLVSVIPGQLWALALSRARGLSPDAPRGLSKVTLTE
jgi:glucosamine--fructose-6-phosphate aminotransferase (isomerizing)